MTALAPFAPRARDLLTVPPVRQWQIFAYRLRSRGRERLVDVLAPDAAAARYGVGALDDDEVLPATIGEADRGTRRLFARKRLTRRDLSLFYVEMARCLRTKMSEEKSLLLVASLGDTPVFRGVIGTLIALLRQGRKLSDGMEKLPTVFAAIDAETVRAGEISGDQESVFRNLADYAVRQDKLMRKFQKAFIAPGIIVAVLLGAILIFHFFLIPQFRENFRALGIELPFFSQLVFGASQFLSDYPVVLLGPVLLAVGVWLARAEIRRSRNYQWLALRLPVIGGAFSRIVLARSLKTLTILYEAKVPALRAYEIAARTAGHFEFVGYFDAIRTHLAGGLEPYRAFSLESDRIRPDGRKVAARMVTGQKTGEIASTLKSVAEVAEEEAEVVVEALPQMVQPLVVVVAGVVVGIIGLAIYLPNIYVVLEVLRKANNRGF